MSRKKCLVIVAEKNHCEADDPALPQRVNDQHHRTGPWSRGGLGYSSTPFWVKHELQKATDTITSLRVRKEGKDKRLMDEFKSESICR